MQDLSSAVFWGAFALLLYTYAGFPVLLAMVGGLRRRGEVRKDDVTPRMSLVIAAYNEEVSVARRLENALSSDYPAERLEVLLASDGSSDATESIAACYDQSGVQLLRLPRRGKIYALEEAVRRATGEVLVFSDANTLLEKHALRALAANFADPAVGGVVGNTGYRLREEAESSGRGESLYWSYDTWLKHLESRTGSVVSAHGGLYAIRKQLYEMPEDPAVTDDFAISTGVVAHGYRLVFEPDARGWEETAASATGEFGRRVRLTTRGLRGVALRRRLLNPFRYGFYSVALLSHKVLRRVLPVGLILLFAASAALSGTSPFFALAFGGQAALYSLAAAGYAARSTAWGRSRLLYVPFYFCLANAAALVALWKFVRGRRIERWEPTRASVVTVHAQATDAPRVWTEASSSVKPSAASASATTSAAASPSAGAAATRPARRRSAPEAPSAVVVGLDSATGLQSARILAARGVPVIGVASDPRHPCCRTRACHSVLKADTTSDELIDVLTRAGAGLAQRGVLVPCTDLSVLAVSRSRAELEPWLHVVMPDPGVVELLVDKARFYDFAAREGFPVPHTFVLRSREDAEEAAKELPFPCIVKPALKTSAWRGRSSAKGYRAANRGELLHLYDRVSAFTHALVAQEWIPGSDTDHYTCNAYFGEGSEPLVTFTSRKLRQWPPTAGEACLSEEVENDAVRDVTIRLFQRVHHRGLGYVEVKQRAGRGEYVILEPNVGRPTGRSAQAEAAGVELLYTQYCDALGWPLPDGRVQSFKGVKWIHMRRDVQSSLHHWRRGELTIRQWARSWRGPKHDALFSVTDPVPFFADLTRAAAKLARRVQRAS